VKEKRFTYNDIRAYSNTIGAFLRSLWVSPRKHPDFAWVWITRALVVMGLWTVQEYMQGYLTDLIGVPPQSRRILVLCHVPQLHSPIHASCGQTSAIGAELEAAHPVPVSPQGSHLLARDRVPNLHRTRAILAFWYYALEASVFYGVVFNCDASRLSPLFSGGPFGTAQLFSAPSISRRKS
jgi:hypothetical protein